MLREDIEQYTKLTGVDGWHVPILKVAAFLDGYNKGLAVLDKIRMEIETERKEVSKKHSDYYFGLNDGLKDARDIIDYHLEEVKQFEHDMEEWAKQREGR